MLTLAERLRAIAGALPDTASVTLPVGDLRAWLAESPTTPVAAPVAPADGGSWRTRLWACPPDTRLGVRDLAEAVGRSTDWAYRATSAKHALAHDREPLPCTKLDGVLTFRAADVRDWLARSELTVNPTAAPARLHLARTGRSAND